MWTGTFPHDIDRLPSVGWWAQWSFTSRTGGTSQSPFDSLNLAEHVGDDRAAVERNRTLLADSLGEPAVSTAFLLAEHGANVDVVMDKPWTGSTGCDGLVTHRADVALVALAADCAPIVLADSANGVVAAIHCGWQGLVAGVVDATISRMGSQGAVPATTRALVGPTICGACYEVPEQRRQEVISVVPAARATSASGSPALDVRVGVCAQLEAANIAFSTIGGCTAESDDLFSFRRDGVTGRQAGAVVLRERP
ncbi:MAG: polyphenol oxidase family protein [Candidatus Nanopelagicales bacterium]